MTFAVPAPTVGNAKPFAPTALTCAVGVAMVLLSSPAHARAAPVDATEPAEAPTEAPAELPLPEEPAPEEPASEEPASSEAPASDAPASDAPEQVDPPEPEHVAADTEDDIGDVGDSENVEADTEEADTEDGDAEPIRPPRFDGPYIGLAAYGTASFASLIDLDTPNPLLGTSGYIQAGDAVFPWMSIGVTAGGGGGWSGDQQMFQGSLLVEFGFAPLKRYPFTFRAGFGFGGGAVSQPDLPRAGFGGALFKGSVRYEFFPLAESKRPDRGGGWAIGPELGWLGATPAGPGQPFVNTLILGLSTSFYFGS